MKHIKLPVHELCKLVVFEYKVISYEQFMDHLSDWELETIIQFLPYSIRQEWNMTRNLMLASLKPYLKDKTCTADKLVPLIGDQDDDEEHDIEMTNEQKELLKKQAEEVRAIIEKGNMVEFDIKNIKS